MIKTKWINKSKKGVLYMPNITYPNQRIVRIHREPAKTDFLGIKNENWKAACRDLSAHALKLYLYLAANADNFEFALSPTAILNGNKYAAFNLPRSIQYIRKQRLHQKVRR